MFMKMKNLLKIIALNLIFIFLITNVSAQNDTFIILLLDYDTETQESQIHIENTAGVELTEVDFYILNKKTGRLTESFPDGNAVRYFQVISPGTYDVTIKTKEGIEFTKSITFEDMTPSAKTREPEVEGKTSASILGKDIELQKLKEARLKEQEMIQKKELERIQQIQQIQEQLGLDAPKVVEEIKTAEDTVTRKVNFNQIAVIILILILIYFIYNFLQKKKRK